MKYLLVIGDGMADNPVAELGNKTPLEVAVKPTFDCMTAAGTMAWALNCPKPLPAGSETALMSIMGCNPIEHFTGRSPMEAAASDLKLSCGQVAYRCNLISVEQIPGELGEKKIISHSAGSIEGQDALDVVTALNADPRFKAALEKAKMVIHPFPAFRQIAVQSGADLTGLTLIPPHDHLGELAGQYLPSGTPLAQQIAEIMCLAHEILLDHPINQKRIESGKLPVNGIWLWAEGTAPSLPSFYEKYGKKGAMISAVPLCHGIAKLMGVDVILVEGATGEIDTNFEGKLEAAYEAIKGDYDFVCIHVEAPDECTHNGDLSGKIKAIEWIDSRILAELARRLKDDGTDYRLLLLADHKTLTATRGHDGDPVPYLIYQSGKDTGFNKPYAEVSVPKDAPLIAGHELLSLLFEQN